MELADGRVVNARRVTPTAVGEATTLSVRPERMEIGHTDGFVALEGVIEELIYLGDHIRVRMNVAGNDEFIVKFETERIATS